MTTCKFLDIDRRQPEGLKMANVIDYTISKVRSQIPPRILNKVFTEMNRFNTDQMVSPEFMIRRQVIEQVVIPDCNVHGGQHVNFKIFDLPKKSVSSGYLIEIPLERTQGRHLTSVQLVGMDGGGLSTGTSIGGMANTIMNVSKGYDSGFSADVRIVAPNVIHIESNVVTYGLRGTIGYDDRISSLDKHYWGDFAKLVILATKAMIYHNYIMELGSMDSNGSAPNQQLVNIIERYESAQEEYDLMLDEEMGKILILSDPLASSDALKLGIGYF